MNSWEYAEQEELSAISGENEISTLWKRVWYFLINIDLPYDLEFLLLDTYPSWKHIHTKIYVRMCIGNVFHNCLKLRAKSYTVTWPTCQQINYGKPYNVLQCSTVSLLCLWVQPIVDWKYSKKIPESSKEYNLKLLYARNYLYSTCSVLGIITILERN